MFKSLWKLVRIYFVDTPWVYYIGLKVYIIGTGKRQNNWLPCKLQKL